MLELVSVTIIDLNYLHYLLITDVKVVSVFISDFNNCIIYKLLI